MLTVKQEILDRLEGMGLDEQRLLLELMKAAKETQHQNYSALELMKLTHEERYHFLVQAFEMATNADYETFVSEQRDVGLAELRDIQNVARRIHQHIHQLLTGGQKFQNPKAANACRSLERGIAQVFTVIGVLYALEPEYRLPKLMTFLAHPWRSPLTAIEGYTDLFLKDAFGLLTAEQRQIIQQIAEDELHLRQWCTDLMDQYGRETNPNLDNS